MKKLVEREHLQYVADELKEIKSQVPPEAQERISNLLIFLESNVLHHDQDSKNEFKRAVYKRMKEAKTEEENRHWYEFYKSLDDMFA